MIEMTPPQAFHVDARFVSRLILGALTEHEQRRLALHLLQVDSGFRLRVLAFLEPFEMFDSDLLAGYAQALNRFARDPCFDLDRARSKLLTQSHERAPDFGPLIRAFTFSDLLRLGEATRRLFSWSMAEYLLECGGDSNDTPYGVRSNLYLALTVIDVVELLGVAGHSPYFPEVVADVRGRIESAYRKLGR
jgi:hypothetical protein